MRDVHLPHLEEHDEEGLPSNPPESAVDAPSPAPLAVPAPHKRHSRLLTIALEVVLISTGVFLGLAGEQWRESSRHHELAKESLQRFRDEILANRHAVSNVKDYHQVTRDGLEKYFAPTDGSKPSPLPVMHGVRTVFFEHTAWDVALATQSLNDLDPRLVFSISKIYNQQQEYANFTQGLVQAMYVRPPERRGDDFFRSLLLYYDDVTVLETNLIEMYDDILPQIDRSLGDSKAAPDPAK